VLAQVVAGFAEHATRAARRVEQLAHRAWLGQQFIVVHEEQVDHEADDFAGREVVTRRLIGLFVEAPDQVLEQQSHFNVVHRAWVEVDLAELSDHQKQDVVLAHALDFVGEIEALEDAFYVVRETVDVRREVQVDVVWVAHQLGEAQRRMVVKPLAGLLVQDAVTRFAKLLALDFFELGEDSGLGAFQHTVESAQNYQRQHDALVLRWAVGAAQQVGNAPDEIRKFVGLAHKRVRTVRIWAV
jgi:hypothetical protein